MASSRMREPPEEKLEGGDGTIDDLKQALVENLEHRGVLGKIRANVRAEIFHTLEGPQENVLPPPLSNDNLLINELVRDYLSYNGYSNALSVFMSESGQPNDRALNRAFMRDELGLTERRDTPEAMKLPLLYGVTHALKRWKEGCLKGGDGDEARHTGIGPPRVSVCGDDGLLTGEYPAMPSAAEGDHGIFVNHAGIGKEDPAPLLFTKHSSSGSRGGDP